MRRSIKLRVSKTARDRASQLFKERIITSAENEAAEVDYANAQATVLRNRAALDLRAQGLEEATVRAPVAGTVIEKDVALGQVIASGTGTFGGGTTILKMADLTKVRVRTLVNETDIGKVRAGLPATVTVDAYPDRPFQGVVEKIEPQATIQQSVTMFPVLMSIDNRSGLLMPGMNGEVSIETERRGKCARGSERCCAKSERSRVRCDVARPQSGFGSRSARVAAWQQFGRSGRERRREWSRQTAQTASTRPDRGRHAGRTGSRAGRIQSSRSDRRAVRESHRGAGKASRGTDADRRSSQRRCMNGELDRQAMQAESQKIYAAVGLDPAGRSCVQFPGSRRGAAAEDRAVRAVGGTAGGCAMHGAGAAAANWRFMGGQRRRHAPPRTRVRRKDRQVHTKGRATRRQQLTMSRKCCRD